MDDPDWASFLPDVKQGGPTCRLLPHEDCAPLDVARVASHLEAGGTLGAMPGYEARPGQLEMVRAVTRAFNGRQHVMIEAGTGVGKSLAYLVPSVLWSFTNETPVILSTATRNLQSQLLASDLPRAVRVLGDEAPKFRFAVLKGRTNYLCLRQLGELMQGGWWTLTKEEQDEFKRLYEWLHRTDSGDLDELGSEVLRPSLSCPSEDCLGRACRYHEKCFILRARQRAQRAHVTVANHALVLTEAACGSAGLLPAYGRLVLDEAHNLEDCATEFFSYELSRPVLVRLVGRLARTSRSRRGPARPRGVLGTIERQLQKGAVRSPERAEAIRALLIRLHVQIKYVLAAADGLFETFKHFFAPAPKGADRIRYRCVPDGVTGEKNIRQYSLQGLFADYGSDQWDERALADAQIRCEHSLARLQGDLGELAEQLQTAAADESLPLFGELAVQVQSVAAALTSFILEAKFILSASDPARIYWAERCGGRGGGPGAARQAPFIRLVAAPLSVADEMKRCFYDVKDSVVLCSATLRTGDKFDYMARKLGFTEVDPGRAAVLTASSPFDYLRQAAVLAPDFLPDPSSDPVAYAETGAPFLVRLFMETKGRGLMLFTSYDMMRSMAERMRPLLEDVGVRLLVQGEGLSREAMADALRTAEVPTVLFGAQSFWEGVDVPGDALSCVVLARLPFLQVGEPIVEARGEAMAERGGSAFRDYLLPEALIRFRQGFGRLVRTRSDRGVVVVTDGRIVTKNYGALFRRAIPGSVHVVSSPETLLERVRAFFADGDRTGSSGSSSSAAF